MKSSNLGIWRFTKFTIKIFRLGQNYSNREIFLSPKYEENMSVINEIGNRQ